jgi:hypothetical protein
MAVTLMRFLDEIPFSLVILACLTLGLAPFFPEPHIWEKLKMLGSGRLVEAVDVFDLLMHAAPWILLVAKLGTGHAAALSCGVGRGLSAPSGLAALTPEDISEQMKLWRGSQPHAVADMAIGWGETVVKRAGGRVLFIGVPVKAVPAIRPCNGNQVFDQGAAQPLATCGLRDKQVFEVAISPRNPGRIVVVVQGKTGHFPVQ